MKTTDPSSLQVPPWVSSNNHLEIDQKVRLFRKLELIIINKKRSSFLELYDDWRNIDLVCRREACEESEEIGFL